MTATPTPTPTPRSTPVLRLFAHLWHLLVETMRYAMATRRFSLVAAIVLGLLLLALTATAQSAAPLLLYPFA